MERMNYTMINLEYSFMDSMINFLKLALKLHGYTKLQRKTCFLGNIFKKHETDVSKVKLNNSQLWSIIKQNFPFKKTTW